MSKTKLGKSIIVLAHAFVGWALCTATMGIGMDTMSEGNALIFHAVLSPIVVVVVSLFYFKKFNYTSPLLTAFIFLAFVTFMDAFLVALLILKNFEMFASILGVWIPFASIFLAAYLTGLYVRSKEEI